MHDHVDTILAQWQHERPDLDSSPIGLIGRIAKLELHLGRALAVVFNQFGLQAGEYDVLAALRRSGEPYQLSPTALYNTLMLSSGAMTNRLERLASQGMIERIPDPHDGRSMLVRLTAHGKHTIDVVTTAHIANEHRLVAALSPEQRTQLADLLRTWLVTFEQG